MNRALTFPPRSTGVELHNRLLRLDAKAPQEVSVLYLPPLCTWLEKAFPNVDPDHRQTAAEDALLAYFQSPCRYNAAKGLDLAAYLRMSARGDLLNILAREDRSWSRHPLRVAWSDVASAEVAGNIVMEDKVPLAALVRRDEDDRQQDYLLSSRSALCPMDRDVFDLMRGGERDTAAFARALGLESLPFAEQRRRVKQAKDRVMKRLQRGEERYGRPA